MTDREDDPTRGFLDETVPTEPGFTETDGPARPRHVQHPTAPEPPQTPKERRAETIRNAAWTFGPSAAFVASAALSDDGDAELRRPERTQAEEPAEAEPTQFDDMSGYGEAGSGL